MSLARVSSNSGLDEAIGRAPQQAAGLPDLASPGDEPVRLLGWGLGDRVAKADQFRKPMELGGLLSSGGGGETAGQGSLLLRRRTADRR